MQLFRVINFRLIIDSAWAGAKAGNEVCNVMRNHLMWILPNVDHEMICDLALIDRIWRSLDQDLLGMNPTKAYRKIRKVHLFCSLKERNS